MARPDNTAKKLIDLDRRRHVASLRLRGFSQREIQKALADPQLNQRNPDTGEPWSLGLINKDIKALEKIWREECADAVEHHKARLFAELREIFKRAWNLDDLERALKSIQQQRDLLGTDAAKSVRAEVTGKDGAPLNPTPTIDLSKLDNAQLDQLEQLLLALGANADAGASPG